MDIEYQIIKYLFKLFGTNEFYNFNLPNKRIVDYSDISDVSKGNETSHVFNNYGNVFIEWFDGKLDVNDFRNKLVLDLGSGFGGRTIYYARHGSRLCVGIDIDKQGVLEGMKYAKYIKQNDVHFSIGKGEKLPFKANSFDYVLSYDVLEHVEDVEKVIKEVHRVLKIGGSFCSVFPPYYSATGSHIKRTNIPWMNVFFKTPKVYEVLKKEYGEQYELWSHKGKILRKGLNGTTVKEYKKYVNESNFNLIYEKYAPIFSKPTLYYKKVKIRIIREMIRMFFIFLGSLHGLREYFTHRIVFIFKKP